MEQLIEQMEHAVLRSAEYMCSFFDSNSALELNYKHDQSMVLNVDLESQRIMHELLNDHLVVVGEEDPQSHQLIGKTGDFFVIDPLDGTTHAKRFKNMRGGQVGYGPLAGLVQNGALVASCYYNLPTRTLYRAVLGQGVRASAADAATRPPPWADRRRIVGEKPANLRACAALFFPGAGGELRIVERLRVTNCVETMYRFGGFASDCVRLALGSEQIHIQFSVKAWDFSAALFSHEAGLAVTIDPLKRRVPFTEWKVALDNPVLSAPAELLPELLRVIDEVQFAK